LQGQKDKPTYSEVCAGTTGHAEAVQVFFDPRECSYESLLGVFLGRHDPTQKDGQGNDKGTQYRGGAYYHSEAQVRGALSQLVWQLVSLTHYRRRGTWVATVMTTPCARTGGRTERAHSTAAGRTTTARRR